MNVKTDNKRFILPLKLQYFSDGNTETNIDNENASETSEMTEKTNEETTQTKTFTQEQLDEIVAKRLERERKKFADYEEIRKKAERYEKELEQKRLAEMSEKERAEEIARKAQEEKDALEKQLNELKTQIEREKIRNEFIKQAQTANIAYIDDALALADLSAVKIDESGNVVGVDDVVKSLIENKPFLLAQKQQPKQIGDASNPSKNDAQKTAEQLLHEAAEKAKKSGRIEDLAAYSKLKRELGL